MIKRKMRDLATIFAVLAAGVSCAMAATPEELISVLKSVGREGKGNPQAATALRELAQSKAKVLPLILRSFGNASPLSANWLRNALETIADRELKLEHDFPAKELEQFVSDRSQDRRARRLAFEWLVKVDESAKDRLVPGLLDDPSSELRREAVQRLIDQAKRLAKNNKKEQAAKTYRKALTGAVDNDQVKAIVGPLKGMGQKVDLQKHFGFLTRWNFIGPFDNHEEKGFHVAYPPEKKVDLAKTYKGQLGEVTWAPLATDNEYGILDIAKDIKPFKGAVMYGETEFFSPGKQKVDVRIGTPNSWKLWINGKLIFAREEYHRGMALDQYRVEAEMKPGRNVLLLKILQNEQKDSWAQRYQFQLRICDGSGTAVPSQPTAKTSQIPNSQNLRVSNRVK